MTKEEFLKDRRIGFTEQFPFVDGSVSLEKVYDTRPRSIHLSVKVSLCKGSFGNGKHQVSMVLTDDKDNRDKLWAQGWGQGVDPEINARKEAVWAFCEENGLQICNVINSYPWEKVVVQKA